MVAVASGTPFEGRCGFSILCFRFRTAAALCGALLLRASAVVCFLFCFGGATCAVVARSRLCARRFGGGAPRCACGLYRFPTPPLAASYAPQSGAAAPNLYPSQSREPQVQRLSRMSGAQSASFQKQLLQAICAAGAAREDSSF